MTTPPSFPDLLRLIDERFATFRAVIAAAPDLGVQVPTCPEWTLLDLAQHMGLSRRRWAATIEAGPDATGRVMLESAPAEGETLDAWLADSAQAMIGALRDAGPDQGSWVWWKDAQSPATCGAVARHQLQEIAVHTYDAQLAVGDPQPLVAELAVDGAEEFLFTCCATSSPWPYRPAVVDYQVTEGVTWRLWLSSEGIRIARLTDDEIATAGPADATARSTAGDLMLVFYSRSPLETLMMDGDRAIFEQLAAWDPSA
ncbi:maleylpyruvate isomerase N-terminal domain-containing protein [Kineosporia sp. J2-2]|uniref:Maleylpyruvate isomerase N-terminal domain-containing protein n=1 Tax=Kineosporia corallincola TaxID=2835133 RepID=A0ABS5TDD8_9ACTN|nr:maleylpyruvate isomerase N-terminal domain-containing protein [Kineosporia corallincola]MBT0768434.1 maleylpyruvate isomerase N-terminal domain-containing protein [Kineosporia corallincola]